VTRDPEPTFRRIKAPAGHNAIQGQPPPDVDVFPGHPAVCLKQSGSGRCQCRDARPVPDTRHGARFRIPRRVGGRSQAERAGAVKPNEAAPQQRVMRLDSTGPLCFRQATTRRGIRTGTTSSTATMQCPPTPRSRGRSPRRRPRRAAGGIAPRLWARKPVTLNPEKTTEQQLPPATACPIATHGHARGAGLSRVRDRERPCQPPAISPTARSRSAPSSRIPLAFPGHSAVSRVSAKCRG